MREPAAAPRGLTSAAAMWFNRKALASATIALTQWLRARLPAPVRVVLRPPVRGLRLARRVVREEYRAWQEMRDFKPTLEKVAWPLTMVPQNRLVHLARLVRRVLAENVRGDFVECGVWRGGAAFLMADLLRRAGVSDRKVWLFDSFEGLPPPQELDGPRAVAYARDTDSPLYFDNCRASLEEVQRSAQRLQVSSYTEFVQGWFEETLPATRARVGPIALLRLDCDWYKSVRCCLDNLYDQVVEGGFVVFDDYFSYEGCAIAVHEFLAERRLPHRLETDNRSACFRKT